MEKELKDIIVSMNDDIKHGETLEHISMQVPQMRPNLVNHTKEIIKKYTKMISPFMQSDDDETKVVAAITVVSLLELKVNILTHYGKQD